MAQQLTLLPLRIQSIYPSRFVSADMKFCARTHDGQDFAIKGYLDAPGIAASEYIGYRLAQCCQIAVPYSTVLTMDDGGLLFGSRIEGNTTNYGTLTPREQFDALRECAKILSSQLALDLFLGNVDRHLNNYLLRKNLDGEWTALAIDFSRALFVVGFPNDPHPQPGNTHTRTSIAALRAMGIWDGPYAVFSLTQVQAIDVAMWQGWLESMPVAWLADDVRRALMTWWGSGPYHQRVQATLSDL